MLISRPSSRREWCRVPSDGFEPSAIRLEVGCSSAELRGVGVHQLGSRRAALLVPLVFSAPMRPPADWLQLLPPGPDPLEWEGPRLSAVLVPPRQTGTMCPTCHRMSGVTTRPQSTQGAGRVAAIRGFHFRRSLLVHPPDRWCLLTVRPHRCPCCLGRDRAGSRVSSEQTEVVT
jgi:hypothetical protein